MVSPKKGLFFFLMRRWPVTGSWRISELRPQVEKEEPQSEKEDQQCIVLRKLKENWVSRKKESGHPC